MPFANMATVEKPAHQQMRKRSKTACEPCRERKRKCDGHKPCRTCTRYEYDCYYASYRSASLPDTIQQKAGPHHLGLPSPNSETLGANSATFLKSLEANSGAAFMRRLGLSIDPANAPKFHLFAWNVGPRAPILEEPVSNASLTEVCVTDIISQGEMQVLASAFFEKIHPCYGYIDRDIFFQHVGARWQSPPITEAYDAVLCGVAALGSYFSPGASASEPRLVALSQSILNSYPAAKLPSVDLILGWICRVVYFRETAAPLAAWMASSTAMHLIEAAGLHREASTGSVLITASECNEETRKRLFGVAQHLNTWISFDLGLSRIALQGAISTPPHPRPGDYTDKLLSLLPMSASLDPLELHDDSKLRTTLLHLIATQDNQPPLILAQCNLMLCILRRVHSYGSLNNPSTDLPIDGMLAFMEKALRAAQSMVTTHSPWHHAANVPFQIVCMLLVIDSRASFRLLKEAMQTLLHVAAYYDTNNLRDAYSTACVLLWLYQKRRSEDVEMIGSILSTTTSRSTIIDESSEASVMTPMMADGEEFPWMNDLTASMANVSDLDIEQVLTSCFLNS
ncbi:hypothetical protein F5884DRAFT_778359 [Xylogone sp. PMI_703]|nr:hypothetical protein F5884DRAFT_778359 [Xylogone sp. PMI_703]